MRLTKELLNSKGIHNSHNICTFAGGKLFLCFHPKHSVFSSRWVVSGINFQTDPTAHWNDRGCKTFSGAKRSDALIEAMDWANEKYGITGWEKDPFGWYQDKSVMDTLREKLKD